MMFFTYKNPIFLVVPLSNPSIPLFSDGLSNTLIPWQANHRLVSLSNDKDIAQPSSKRVARSVFNVDDIKTTRVPVSAGNHADPAQVTASSSHTEIACVKLDPVLNFARLDVDFHGVAVFNVRVGVPDASAVVGAEDWDAVFADAARFYAAELVGGFLGGNSVDLESPFGVVDEAEIFVGFVDADDVHKPSWEFAISPNLTVDLNSPRHHDLLNLVSVKSILQSISDKDTERKAFPKFVWACSGSVGVDTTGFWEHPVVGCCEGFEVLFGAASTHFWIFLLCSVSST